MPQKFGGYFHPFPIWDTNKTLTKAESALRQPIDTVMWYQWWDAGALSGGKRATRFQSKWVAAAGKREVLIKWEPWKPGKKIIQPNFALRTITAGTHDTYLRAWAAGIRSHGQTIHLCPMPEMNGFWNQWSVPIGKHEPADFIAAWRHIHDLFAREGAANVRWVWAPNAGDMPPEYPMESFYPGHDYVDVLGLSVYNWGTTRPWSTWQSCEEVLQPYYDRLCKLGDQPVWIAEMGCAPIGGDKVAWVRDTLAYLPGLERLETVIWFNMKKETDWRITVPGVKELFAPQ
jgi:mannan endo-1,4-beta-mannosidase